MENEFKKCPMCGYIWPTREDFLKDKLLNLNGYSADFEKLEYGLFFFTHNKTDCGSTLVLEAVNFLDMYDGPKYSERKTKEPGCPGYCLDQDNLERCDMFCECAFVREVLNKVKETMEA